VPAVASKKKRQTTDVAKLQAQVERYEAFIGEIDSFVGFVRDRRDELKKVRILEAELKCEYDGIRARRKDLEDAILGAKDSLYQLVEPGANEFMPLIDRMEPTDPEKHGEHASQWRVEPIAVLRLSPTATRLLVDAEVIAIGQLQDRVLASPDWWQKIDGMSEAIAAAVVDRLNDFIFTKERGDHGDE
jgi:hypothetical protein